MIRTKTAAKIAVLVLQQHGGAILSRGMLGNRGGTGRPSNALRERMRHLASLATEELIARLERGRAAQLSVADLVGILTASARHGLGATAEQGVLANGQVPTKQVRWSIVEVLR